MVKKVDVTKWPSQKVEFLSRRNKMKCSVAKKNLAM